MGHRSTPTRPPERAAVWLTRLAFGISAALVLARATMLETLRNPLDVFPGQDADPRGPGAATGVVLDLVGCLPALLVLLRRAFDTRYPLRFTWSLLPLAGLACWTVASVAWSGDRFAAAVSGFHWLAASVLLWSTAQLVRDWKHLRLVAAIAFGLLLVQLGQGFYYRLVEHPEAVAQWAAKKEEILRQRGWEPGSFTAQQFEKRIASGEIMGFTASENSYGAVVVMLTFVAAGVLIQRMSDRGAPGWAAAVGIAIALSVVMILLLRSRTADLTPVIGAAALTSVWLLRGWLGRNARLAYALGVGVVLLAIAAVVGHGLYHGTLPTDSLAFRWRYWVASAKLFARHPLLGVGWENFGPHYLSVRLPVAAEEIKDPHDFIVRFATELGVVGLVLLVAWMLTLWWDLTTRTAPGGDAADQEPGAIDGASPLPPLRRIGPGATPPTSAAAALRTIVGIGAGGMVLNVLATIDWGQSTAYVTFELMKRVGMLCLFIVGTSVAALHSMERQELDDRPAPWALVGMLVGAGLFLVHNLVDFSLFEPGPMFLFMFLTGAALGIRMPSVIAAGGSPRAPRVARFVLVAAVIAWLATAVAFAAPVVIAEQAAAEGDAALGARQFDRSSEAFDRALSAVPYDADYAFRAARALLFAEDPRRRAEKIFPLLDRAIATDPDRADYWLARANAEGLRPVPDLARLRAGYDAALRLDPNNVQVRLDYATMLRRLGDAAGARGQYAEALRYDDLLSPDEPKRLPPEKVAEVRNAIADLDAAAPRATTGPA
jgi:O-antigen ligase